MTGKIQYFIDDCGQNFLEVEYTAEWGWTAGAGDKLYIDVCGVSLNGLMSLRITDVQHNAPDWWQGINEQIKKEAWEQVAQAA